MSITFWNIFDNDSVSLFLKRQFTGGNQQFCLTVIVGIVSAQPSPNHAPDRRNPSHSKHRTSGIVHLK
jgi:hypothetical protein